jgi:putative effector of murein hydrolase LrgA (UPF0299 family)
MTTNTKIILPLALVFAAINISIPLLDNIWKKFNVDTNLLLLANLFFFLLHMLVFVIQRNALKHSNPNVFIRSVMSGLIIKMFTTGVAVMAYVLIIGKTYSANGVFVSLFFYLFYLAAEVYAIMQLNKNAKGTKSV